MIITVFSVILSITVETLFPVLLITIETLVPNFPLGGIFYFFMLLMCIITILQGLKKFYFPIYIRSNIYIGEKKYDKAIENCTKAIELKPNLSEAYLTRGNAYSHKEEYDNAIEDYTKAIEIKSDYRTYNNRGNAYSHKEEYDKAIDDCTRAIELDPEYADAHTNRDKAYAAKAK